MPFQPHRRRSEAERAILSAIAHCDQIHVTPAQCADLADAVDAYREKSYSVAYELARAAERSRRISTESARPAQLGRSLEEIRADFAEARARRLARPASPPYQPDPAPTES